jgi:isopenicillin N synthase-like dioxygenase
MRYSNAIPVIDVEPLFRRDDLRAMQRVLRDIREVASEIGFFYLAGHQISPVLLRAVYLCSMHFLSLAEKFKNELSTTSAGTRYIVEKRSVFSDAKIAAAKDFYPAAGSRIFPAASHKRHPAIDKAAKKFAHGSPAGLMELYYRNIFSLCRSMLEGCAIAQGAEPDLFQCIYEHPVLHAQLVPWEPSGSPAANHETGALTPFGEVLILWTDDKNGSYTGNPAQNTARPAAVEGRFALRIADMMARWSNDLLISAPHRIVDSAGNENFWIPAFYKIDDSFIDTVEGCLVAPQPKRFPMLA